MTDSRLRRLVLCSGAQVPLDSPLATDRKIVELDSLDPKSNVHLRLDNVTRTFEQRLPGRFVDLLELATYVYCADCEASRGHGWMDDDATELWDRDFHIVMPVRDYGFWQQEAVRERLLNALSFLSGDHFSLEFQQLDKHRPVQDYLRITDYKDGPFYHADRITMFSGGLDSLAGAVESAVSGSPVVLVSHRPVVQTNKRQRELFRLLDEHFEAEMMHVPVWVNKTHLDREPTQRTRSFLYSALGTAVAHVLEAGGVRFYENGVMSLNLPIAGEVLRSRASRTTHPLSLHYLEQFYRLLTGHSGFVLDNPYVFKTKAEVVGIIHDHGAAELIQHSCSCTHTMFQTSAQWHCGRCGQCIDRRVAVLAADLASYDPEEDYVTDVFAGLRKTVYDHNIALDYALSAGSMAKASEEEIGCTYSLELARATRPFEDRGDAADQFIRMHKRHGASVARVLADQLRLHADGLVSRTIEPSSLVAMVGRQMEQLGQGVSAADDQYLLALHPSVNLFRNMSEYWIVAYEGRSALLRDHKGVRYIAILLQHQEEELDSLHLVWLENRKMLAADPNFANKTVAELADEGLVVEGFGDAGPIMDEEYEKHVRSQLAELQDKRDLAEVMGDIEAVAAAESDIKEFAGSLSEGIGLAGRHRRAGSPSENARIATTQAIRRALARIGKAYPALGDHLTSAINTGNICSYRPSAHVDWEF